ncbi:hypothetical protein B0G66_1256 [Bacillus badius]|nr:hypothetical protein B0G66_1256 [Bacillus badius]
MKHEYCRYKKFSVVFDRPLINDLPAFIVFPFFYKVGKVHFFQELCIHRLQPLPGIYKVLLEENHTISFSFSVITKFHHKAKRIFSRFVTLAMFLPLYYYHFVCLCIFH